MEESSLKVQKTLWEKEKKKSVSHVLLIDRWREYCCAVVHSESTLFLSALVWSITPTFSDFNVIRHSCFLSLLDVQFGQVSPRSRSHLNVSSKKKKLLGREFYFTSRFVTEDRISTLAIFKEKIKELP